MSANDHAFHPSTNAKPDARRIGSRILSGKAIIVNISTGRDTTQPALIDKPDLNLASNTLYQQDPTLGKALEMTWRHEGNTNEPG
ncbi:MAG: hypothetical protein H7240_06570 [Glaciimonas sp.]|nr:hypothetical protein [Glaciimonas sp.]